MEKSSCGNEMMISFCPGVDAAAAAIGEGEDTKEREREGDRRRERVRGWVSDEVEV